jgi:hypothetical protein
MRPLLCPTEFAAIAIAVTSAASWAGASFSVIAPGMLKAPLICSFAALFPLFLTGASRATSIARAMNPAALVSEDEHVLSHKHYAQLLRLAPKLHCAIGLFGVGLLFYAAISEGAVSWSTSEPFTSTIAIAMAKYTLAISSAILPVLAALNRAPRNPEAAAKWLDQMSERADR